MNFHQLSELLFNNYLLADSRTLQLVLHQYEKAQVVGGEQIGVLKKPLSRRKYQVKVLEGQDSKIGVIPIKGSLTYEETGFEALCGMTSYESIQGQAEYLIKNEKVSELILELNSGGGQAYGCFEAAQSVRNLANKNNVKITTYVDGVAYSGGYAWASIADEVIVNPMGRVGSIGIVLPLTNYAEKDKKDGIKRIYITSGKSKVPYDEDGNFTEAALDEFRKSSKIIYDEFVGHVAEMRGIDRQSVVDTEAKTFDAQTALGLKLIDSIMTKEQFYNHVNGKYGENVMSLVPKTNQEEEVSTTTNDSLISTLTEEVTGLKANAETLQETISTLTSEKETLSVELEQVKSTLTGKDEEIKTLQDKIVELQGKAEEVKVSSREEQIKALVSVDEVESVMSIASVLDDEKFGVYVETLKTKQVKTREEMKEVGGAGVDNEIVQLSTAEKIAAKAKAKQAQ
jgi:ClpP class serine protease